MPCYTPPHAGCKHDDTEIDNYECQTLEGINGLVSKWRYYRSRSDQAVAFLCEVMSKIDESKVDIGLSEKLHGWWKEHKQFDYDRKHKK